MRWRALAIGVLWLATTATGLTLLAAGHVVRSPLLMDWRPWPLAALIALALALVALVVRARLSRRSLRWLSVAPALLALAGLWSEVDAALTKRAVLAAPRDELRAVARHLIVGFASFEDLPPLVIDAGVGGVFVARRNARGLDAERLAREIDRLQGLRRRAGLPPLWIATDQEGGPVASLSPPLPPPVALGTLTHDGDLLIAAARDAARDLACAGVNVNFAPVVDVEHRAVELGEAPAPISRRTISPDERVVAAAARDYCRTLDESGVQCTLKHFPGLGPVKADTHQNAARLGDLSEADLVPFREVAAEERPWIMLGHVTVESIDPERPASASPGVIGLLRKDWGFDGVLITDDMSMFGFARDFRRNAVSALAGGGDLLLASWDPDYAWDALYTLLRERRVNPALAAAMAQSDVRLARDPARAPLCRRLAAR